MGVDIGQLVTMVALAACGGLGWLRFSYPDTFSRNSGGIQIGITVALAACIVWNTAVLNAVRRVLPFVSAQAQAKAAAAGADIAIPATVMIGLFVAALWVLALGVMRHDPRQD